MNFREFYILFSENIEQNFGHWFDTLTKYSKNYDEKQFLDKYHPFATNLVTPQNAVYLQGLQLRGGIKQLTDDFNEMKFIIINVLKEQNLENLNWLSFCLGYRSVKKFRKEDLEMAIEVTKKAIDSGELPKSEIGIKGWFQIGIEAKDRIAKYLEKQNEPSKREIERRKKRGEADLEEEFVKLIATENNTWHYPLKLYYLPRLNLSVESNRLRASRTLMVPVLTEEDKNKINQRHQILCKLGKGTEWCTAQPSWDAHKDYALDDIYIIHEKDTPMYQFVSCVNSFEDNRQFMDTNDDEVDSLISPIFKFVKKYANNETNCYKLKEFLSSPKDLLNLKNLKNVDFISINRMITNISGNWFIEAEKKLPDYNHKTHGRSVVYDKDDIAWTLNGASEPPSETVVKDYEHYAKITNTQHLRLSEEKVLIPIFNKLLELIDDGLKRNKNMSNIIDTFEQNLNTSGRQSFTLETFRRFEREIKAIKVGIEGEQ